MKWFDIFIHLIPILLLIENPGLTGKQKLDQAIKIIQSDPYFRTFGIPIDKWIEIINHVIAILNIIGDLKKKK